MDVERRFANLFRTGEAAHAFETAVRSAALEAGLTLGPGGTTDRGLPGVEVLLSLSGVPEAVAAFAAELHEGVRLQPIA